MFAIIGTVQFRLMKASNKKYGMGYNKLAIVITCGRQAAGVSRMYDEVREQELGSHVL